MNAVREWPSILQFGTGETITETLVEKKYRQLAKKYHPDAGGTTADMQELNEAKKLALAWIARERQRLAVVEIQTRRAPDMATMNRVAQQYDAANQQQHSQAWANSMGGLGGAWYGQGMANAANWSATAASSVAPDIKPELKKSRYRRVIDALKGFVHAL